MGGETPCLDDSMKLFRMRLIVLIASRNGAVRLAKSNTTEFDVTVAEVCVDITGWEDFAPFREDIVGINRRVFTPFGEMRLTYADWTASGRLSASIEKTICDFVAPSYGNTHSEDSYVGRCTTSLYDNAHEIVHRHVNAGLDDIVFFRGSGMTGGINWLQYMLGLRRPATLPSGRRPVVFVTHMEHHSNHISWNGCCADVFIIEPDEKGLPDLNHLDEMCTAARRAHRPIYCSVTACSNVTGITTDYHQIAKLAHQHGGKCFVDFSASAPYVDINMHPGRAGEDLDGIFFSPHKFLGGPGAAGVVVINSDLYTYETPVNLGGGIVKYTTPWKTLSFYDDPRSREDAGTPAILPVIRAGLAILLKELMGTARIQRRKKYLLQLFFDGLSLIKNAAALAPEQRERQGIVSLDIKGVHYSLAARILSDVFGVQARGGCFCAGTYGHYLLGMDENKSRAITSRIDRGDYSTKPGWVRLSLHPTMTDEEVQIVLQALHSAASQKEKYRDLYTYDPAHNTWRLSNVHVPLQSPQLEDIFHGPYGARPPLDQPRKSRVDLRLAV